MSVKLSALNKTWLLDLDGTLIKHNGYLNDSDEMIEGVKEFYEKIPKDDVIILLTSRKKKYEAVTKEFLSENGIRYNHIIFDLPYGERILMNDKKESGLITAFAINLERNNKWNFDYEIDDSL